MTRGATRERESAAITSPDRRSFAFTTVTMSPSRFARSRAGTRVEVDGVVE